MKKFLPFFILFVVVLAAGCIGSENSTTTSSSMQPETTNSTGAPVETWAYTESVTSYTATTGSFVLSGDIVYYYVHDSTTETVATTGEFTFTYTQLGTINTETYLVYDDGNSNRVVIDTANGLTWIIISGAETTTTVYGSS